MRGETMDIQTLGSWGEFLGGIGALVAALGVVGSLIFVGFQLRAAARQSSADSYASVTLLWTNFTNATAANEGSWRIFNEGMREYGSWPRIDQNRFNFLIGMYLGILDTVMVSRELGVWKNEETFERNMNEAYAVFMMPGTQIWWQEHKGRIFAPRVEDYLVARMETERAKG
jgi:hypothetical protein